MKRLRLIELIAWSGCALCVAIFATVKVQARATERIAEQIQAGHEHPYLLRSVSSSKNATGHNVKGDSSDILGRLEIAPLHLSVAILKGFDPAALRKGVGHLDGTAMPGGLGNMALAGHRDTFFRPLRNIRKGMAMSVDTATGRYEYVVDSTAIVTPEDVKVVSIHNVPEMTLITCYPFEFIGSAPQRFIVTAHLQSLEPQDR